MIEVLKQAYQLLLTEPHAPTVCNQLEVILRQAIAELESQEPVAWMFQHDETNRMNYVSNDGIHNPAMFLEMNPRYALVCPLYTHPPQRTWVELTDTQIEQVYFEVVKEHRGAPMPWGQVQFGRALLEKFKEKNT